MKIVLMGLVARIGVMDSNHVVWKVIPFICDHGTSNRLNGMDDFIHHGKVHNEVWKGKDKTVAAPSAPPMVI
jgi:hypothetical protein